MNDIRMRFGKRIRQLRQMQDLTQEQLAEAANLSVSFLGGVERGVKSPTIETLEKLATALGVTLAEMMNFDSGVKLIDDDKTVRLRRLLSEYTDKIEKLYKE